MHTIKHIAGFTILPIISFSIKSLLWKHENHNLPPPKIRDQASKFSQSFVFFPFSIVSLSIDSLLSLFLLFFLFSLFKPSFFYPN